MHLANSLSLHVSGDWKAFLFSPASFTFLVVTESEFDHPLSALHPDTDDDASQ